MKNNINNQTIKIKSIKNKINSLKILNIDTREFEKKLEEIETSLLENSKKNEYNYKRIYSELEQLERYLKKYDVLIKIKNTLEKLKTSIYTNNKTNLEDIKYYRKRIINLLKIIEECDYTLLSEFHNTLNDFYQILYTINKLEIHYNNKSDILNYMKRNQIGILELDTLIKNEIKNIYESINYIPHLGKLKASLNKFKENNDEDLLVEDEIIKPIVLCTKEDLIKEYLKEYLDKTLKKIEKNLKEIKNKTEDIDFEELNQKREKLTTLKRCITKKASALLLAFTIIVTGGKFLKKDNLKSSYYDVYQTKTIYYSSDNNYESERKIENLPKLESENQVHFEVTSYKKLPLINVATKVTETYDITDYIEQDQYLDYSELEELGLKPIDTSQDYISADEIKNTIYKYIYLFQDYNNKRLHYDKERYDYGNFLINSIVIALNILIVLSINEKDLKNIEKYLLTKKEIKTEEQKVNSALEKIKSNETINMNLKALLKGREELVDDEKLYEEIEHLLKQNKKLKLKLRRK